MNYSKQELSDAISGFLTILETARKDYEWNYAEVGRLDAMTQDYLHNLELSRLDYRERTKLATKLRDCRRRRRTHKDITVILYPLVNFIDSSDGKKFMSMLRDVLGQTRKEERYLQNRVYIPRTSINEKEGNL